MDRQGLFKANRTVFVPEPSVCSDVGVWVCLAYLFIIFLHLGGFAKVKLARHILTGEMVAIKIMDKNALGVSFRLFKKCL